MLDVSGSGACTRPEQEDEHEECCCSRKHEKWMRRLEASGKCRWQTVPLTMLSSMTGVDSSVLRLQIRHVDDEYVVVGTLMYIIDQGGTEVVMERYRCNLYYCHVAKAQRRNVADVSTTAHTLPYLYDYDLYD